MHCLNVVQEGRDVTDRVIGLSRNGFDRFGYDLQAAQAYTMGSTHSAPKPCVSER